MPTIKYPKNPNIDTAFVEQDDGTKNRALMIAPQDISTLELPNNPNSTKGYITVDGQKQRVILTADITGGGGGGSALPDQTGHSGEFLTTDGTDASWAAINALQNTATGTDSLSVGKATTANNVVTVVNSNAASVTTAQGSAVVGSGAVSQARDGVAFGRLASIYSTNGEYGIAIGGNSGTHGRSGINIGYGAGSNGGNGDYGIAIGREANAKQNYSIQLGRGDNNEAGTFYVASYYNSANVNYKLMDADGTIPTARFTTDPVSDGTYVPTLTISSGVATRSWSAPSSGLPSQTGNAGKFLTTDGTDASWSDKPLVNTATGNNSLTVGGIASTNSFVTNIGKGSNATANVSTVIGYNSSSTAGHGIAIGIDAKVTALYAIQIGGDNKTNSDANTFKVANANGNFEIMDSNGNLPADRLASTTGLADGNYRLRLTMASGVPTLSWVAE